MRHILRKERLKITGVLLAVALLAAGAAIPQQAAAAPQAPNWLPGQPMLAGNQVIAMWLPVPGAVKYIIYLNGEKLVESAANQYMGLAPEKGGEYKYQVKAVDAAGAESPLSREGLIKIVVITPPTNIMVRPSPAEKRATFRWTSPAGAAFVNVYESESKTGPFNFVESVQISFQFIRIAVFPSYLSDFSPNGNIYPRRLEGTNMRSKRCGHLKIRSLLFLDCFFFNVYNC